MILRSSAGGNRRRHERVTVALGFKAQFGSNAFAGVTGILAARTGKSIVQTYVRDMGGGNFVMLKEIDAPIRAGNRSWGAVRLAVKLS